MKKSFKKIISIVLVLIVVLSTIVTVHVGATDTPTEGSNVATEATEATLATELSAPTDATTSTEESIESTQETEIGTMPPSSEPSTEPSTEEDIKVGKVGSLIKDSGTPSQIVFHWAAVKGADGYCVYIKNFDKDKDYKLLVTTSSTKITVKNLSHTTPYGFKVRAFVEKGSKKYYGEYGTGTTATQPAATNKPTLRRSSTMIEISWNRNEKADGYRIYRQHAATNGKLVHYATVKNNKTTIFTDKKVSKGRAYNYKVVAYREMYKGRTYYGTGKTLRTLASLCAPALSSSTTQVSRASFVWKKNAYAKGYDVYYSTKHAGPYTLLKTTKNTYLNTPRLKNGVKYYFRIKPYTYVGTNKVYGSYLSTSKTISNKAYGKSIGNTYIEISIKQQRMWYYINGKLYVETPVVTGNYYGYSTPKGAYKVWQRSSPATLTGPTWCVNVNYWLAFTYSGCGIHDSTWRSSSEYGGTTYIGNGSHGCVNTPYSKVKQIYSKAKIGTHVVVY
ncbi:MAG: L,D-transpeptidase family protein [Ruminococcus sp.]|nr:L,D-transpeptidase family protein [Ruminococcus sp.]